MNHLLEYKIELNVNPENKNLYTWCLNEYDDKGTQVSSDLIPWSWTLYFTASSLRVAHSQSVLKNDEQSTSLKYKPENSTKVFGILRSGVTSDNGSISSVVHYSMLGSKRAIDCFQLLISPVDSAEQEYCMTVAIPSYEYEADFRDRLEPDFVSFEIGLETTKFHEIVKRIETDQIDFLWLTVKEVSGFYAAWSPSISTSFVKILASSQNISNEDSKKVSPPCAGSVGEIDVNFGKVRRLELTASHLPVEHDRLFVSSKYDEDVELLVEPIDAPIIDNSPQSYSVNLDPVAASLSSLKLPLWAIFIVLVIILFLI